jgi:hypothetical protein
MLHHDGSITMDMWTSNINCTLAIGWEGIYSGSCGDMSWTHVRNTVKELVALLLERRRTTSCPGRLWK